jgi:hypothetical protein
MNAFSRWRSSGHGTQAERRRQTGCAENALDDLIRAGMGRETPFGKSQKLLPGFG